MVAGSDEPQLARITVVDDDAVVRKAWWHMLHRPGFEVHLCADAQEALLVLERTPMDVIITDVMMSGMNGLELLQHVKRTRPEIEVIIMTGKGRFSDAVAATKAGAFDYITKPFHDVDACINRVLQALRLKRLREENLALREQVEGTAPSLLYSKSPAMRRVIHQLQRVAGTDATVLITGPTGAGKTAIARALHDRSQRADKGFVHVDGGAIPQELIEAELFGYVKGAFSGAVTEKPGLFEEANGGTLFLDEIGNMPLSMQPKLLRVLNDGVVRRVGSNKDLQVDVRLISATHVDLTAEALAGRFREDLYFRLKVVDIRLPSLNDRREDIPLLAHTILRREAQRHGMSVRGISPECMERLRIYDWKGNIRELANVLERAVIFETEDELSARSLPPEFLDASPTPPPAGLADLVDLEKPWKDAVEGAEAAIRGSYLRGVLDRFDRNVTQAANHAGLDRSNFRRHLRRYLPDY